MLAAENSLNRVFFALADATRRAMLTRLAAGPLTVRELGQPLSISPPAVSKHLKVLEQAGLIHRLVRGRAHVLSLRPQGLEPAARWIRDERSSWERHLDDLEQILKAKQPHKSRDTR